MELRYLGFEQLENARGYRFNLVAKDDSTRQFIVTVDLALFRAHGVGIQEGPSLCAQKLLADLASRSEGAHELTTEDLRAYAQGRAAAEARRIEARKGGPRRPKTQHSHPPKVWHDPRI